MDKVAYSKRNPLEDACPLMSSPVRGCEFSTTTSGTERERGFVGIGNLAHATLCSKSIGKKFIKK